MTSERFLGLVQAWGADRRRWPEAERTAADAFAAANPHLATPALAEADEVDALLFVSRTPQVSMELRNRVIAAATRAGGHAGRTGRRWLDRLTLAFGAGWAVAACAGVVAGVLVAGHLTADLRADAVLYQATLTGVDDVEVLG